MAKVSRNQQNYQIMTVVYNELTDFVYGDGSTVRDAITLMSEICECPYEEIDDYIKASVVLSLQKYGEIKEKFIPNLTNWKWERLPLLTQTILIISYVHYYFVEKIDKRIVINTAIELAKKYVDIDQAKFVNGILDKVLH